VYLEEEGMSHVLTVVSTVLLAFVVCGGLIFEVLKMFF
jgi:hypothetical protein